MTSRCESGHTHWVKGWAWLCSMITLLVKIGPESYSRRSRRVERLVLLLKSVGNFPREGGRRGERFISGGTEFYGEWKPF